MSVVELNPYYYYYNLTTGLPWASLAAAYAIIPVPQRAGKVIAVGNPIVEYWWPNSSSTANGNEVAKGGGSSGISGIPVATYAAMIAIGAPSSNCTIFKVLADENKSYTNSTYIWWANGKRVWVASTDDN